MRKRLGGLVVLFILAQIVSACAGGSPTGGGEQAENGLRVLAVETFLADIAQNVAGDRLTVEVLVPVGVDPHAFEVTPRDVVRVAESDILIANGAGFEEWLDETLQNAGGERRLIEASAGLQSRTLSEDEPVDEDDDHGLVDPHFWLDPTLVVRYVENIRDGLSAADPQGREVYALNAAAYIAELEALDEWIQSQVTQIPPERRKLVTNHESFGYYADRYGFTIQGTVVAGTSSSAAPSAQQMAALVEEIRASDVKAIFLETGSNPDLARQLAAETGIQVVTELYSHSTTGSGEAASTYIEMMKTNTNIIVNALKDQP